MRISACITTRNRTEHLNACLQSLWSSTVKPHNVIVSDDSPDKEVQQKNSQVVKQYPGTSYIIGPRAGVCANRNHAVNATSELETDFVAFIDDDISVDPDFIACAVARYIQMSKQQRKYTIISGVTRNEFGYESSPTKLSFRGYFTHTDVPQAVAIHAALFPRSFFKEEQWDENIFFGYEDAELCLRALKRGYQILHCPEIRVLEMRNESSLAEVNVNGLSKYEIYIEAARLYVGVKRYKYLFPNSLKLTIFIAVYFIHMTAHLLKRRSLKAWSQIINQSKIQQLWKPSPTSSSLVKQIQPCKQVL